MRERIKLVSVLLMGIIFLVACGSKAELSEYVDVHFDGYDTIGTAYYTVDEERLIADVFNVTDEDYWELDDETYQEIENMMSAFSIDLQEATDLTNGDEVVVRLKVDQDKTDKIKTQDEVAFEVSGLVEPEQLSDEEIEKNVVVNFNGFSGKGTIQIDTTFDGDLY